MQALDYCHSKKIIHRDIKFQNILLTQKIENLPENDQTSKIKIKVVDFGIFGTNRGICAERSTAGSLKFMSPELLTGKTHSTPKIDVWSVGCMLHAMVLGDYPFSANEREDLKKQILTKQILLLNNKQAPTYGITNDCLELIERMLIKNPDLRISVNDIIHHPWLMNYKKSIITDNQFYLTCDSVTEDQKNCTATLVEYDQVKCDIKQPSF